MRRGESDTEQVPLLDEGGIEGFLRGELTPGRNLEQLRVGNRLYSVRLNCTPAWTINFFGWSVFR